VEESITQVFIDSRNEEYKEVIEKCEDYFKEIEFEIGRQNFIFAEVEGGKRGGARKAQAVAQEG